MNLTLIDRVILAYEPELDEVDRKRLAFFRALWAEMDRWSTGPTTAKTRYQAPDADEVVKLYHEDIPVFARHAPEVSYDRFVAVFGHLRDYVMQSGYLSEEDCDNLSALDIRRAVAKGGFTNASSNPESFLSDVVLKALVAGANESMATMVALLSMLTLRVELEPCARMVAQRLPKDADAHGYPLTCPVCGSVPALGKVGGESHTDGRGRSLYCAQCGTAWDFDRVRCARCGTHNQAHLHYFNIEGDDGHRIATCDECGGYLRSVFLDDQLKPFSYEVEDVVTARLDAIAHDPRFSADNERI